MPVKLLSSAIKVRAGIVEVGRALAPVSTVKVRVSVPANARVYVGPSPSTAFTASISTIFARNPTNLEHFQFGAPGALVDYQWKSSAPTGNQVLIGGAVSPSIDNLVTKLNGAGFQATNISSGGVYGIGIYIPSSKGTGPAMDEWQIYGEPYMSSPAPTFTAYAADAGQDLLGAGQELVMDCQPGWGVAVLGEGGIADSLPSAGKGGSISYWAA